MAHRAVLRQGAALLACALLLGCGGGGGAGGGGAAGAGVSAASGRERYEGRYEGHRFPADTAAATCRSRAREVRFEVENGIVEMRTGRRVRQGRKAELWGAVSTDGQVAMRPASGRRTVVGRIEGDRLAATDTQDAQAIARAAAKGGKVPCLYRYEAVRVGPRSAFRGGGDASAADAAPPVERVPQP